MAYQGGCLRSTLRGTKMLLTRNRPLIYIPSASSLSVAGRVLSEALSNSLAESCEPADRPVNSEQSNLVERSSGTTPSHI